MRSPGNKYDDAVYASAEARLAELKTKRLYEGLDEEEVSLYALLVEVLATRLV